MAGRRLREEVDEKYIERAAMSMLKQARKFQSEMCGIVWNGLQEICDLFEGTASREEVLAALVQELDYSVHVLNRDDPFGKYSFNNYVLNMVKDAESNPDKYIR